MNRQAEARRQWPTFQPTITVGTVQVLHGSQGRLISRQEHTLWLVLDGRIHHKAPKKEQTTVAGPVCFLQAPGVEVAWDAGTRFRSICFKNTGTAVFQLPPELPQHCLSRCERLILHWSDRWWRTPKDLYRCNMELGQFLLDISDEHIMDKRDEAADDDSWARELRRLIADSLPEGPTAETLARALGISRAHLYRQAKARATSIGILIDEVRWETSLKLLRDGSIRVGGAARMCGFKSHAIFSRWFKDKAGLSPTEWRKEHIPGFTVAKIDGVSRKELGNWDQKQRFP